MRLNQSFVFVASESILIVQQKINNSTSDGKTVKAYIYFEINNDPTNYVNSNGHTLLLMKHENVS